MRQYYRARYPNVNLRLIEQRIAEGYPQTVDEEKRCTALAREDEQRCKVHNMELMAAIAAKELPYRGMSERV